MSMIALSGTRTSSWKCCPSGFAKACTVTSRGMSCADTRATNVAETIRKRAATPAALCLPMALLRGVGPGPDHALVRLGDRSHPLVDEPLQALSFPGFRRVDVAFLRSEE